MKLDEIMKEAADEHGLNQGTDFFNFSKSGEYKLRVLSLPSAMATHFFGKGVKGSICYGADKGCPFHGVNENDENKEHYKNPTVKFTSYILDRSDGKVKLGELPWSVVSALSDYEKNEDWAFDGYPMPYDITVKYDKENKDPKQIYKTIPSPKREPISAEAENEFVQKEKKQSVASYVQGRKDKQMEEHKEKGIWLSEEARVKRQQDYIASQAVGDELPVVEYPDGPNPDDIPF